MSAVRIVTALVPEGFVLNWRNKKVYLSSSGERSKVEWDYLKSLGLNGKYGHTLNLDNCWFTDLITALSVAAVFSEGEYGYEVKIYLDDEAELQLKREEELERLNPVPEGAVT